jgi:hypothetical protein
MILDRRAHRSDVALVLIRPSKITRDEIAATGLRPTDWVKSMQRDLDYGGGRTIWLDKAPIAVLTWRSFTPTQWLTSFAATADFFASIAPTLYMRRMCRRIVLSNPTVSFAVTTRSNHPDAERWLQALGVIKQGDNFEGGAHVLR